MEDTRDAGKCKQNQQQVLKRSTVIVLKLIIEHCGVGRNEEVVKPT